MISDRENTPALCRVVTTVTVCHSANGNRFGNVTLSPMQIRFPPAKVGVVEKTLSGQNGQSGTGGGGRYTVSSRRFRRAGDILHR